MAEGAFRPNGDRLAGYSIASGNGTAYVQRVALVDDAGAFDGSTAAMATSIGSTSDTAWDGIAADATVISLLKAIAINTTPAA